MLADAALQALTNIKEHPELGAAALEFSRMSKLDVRQEALLGQLRDAEVAHLLEGNRVAAVKQCYDDWLVSTRAYVQRCEALCCATATAASASA